MMRTIMGFAAAAAAGMTVAGRRCRRAGRADDPGRRRRPEPARGRPRAGRRAPSPPNCSPSSTSMPARRSPTSGRATIGIGCSAPSSAPRARSMRCICPRPTPPRRSRRRARFHAAARPRQCRRRGHPHQQLHPADQGGHHLDPPELSRPLRPVHGPGRRARVQQGGVPGAEARRALRRHRSCRARGIEAGRDQHDAPDRSRRGQG